MDVSKKQGGSHKLKNIRFSYTDGATFKTFSTRKAFLEWAKDENHNGTYYISYPNMTVTHTRAQVQENYK